MDKPQNYWNEFDWERFFRRKEKFVRAYVELLDRFAELPEGEELILNELTRRFGAAEVEEMYTYDEDVDDDFPDEDESAGPDDAPMASPLEFPPADGEGWQAPDNGDDDSEFNDEMRRLRRMEEQFRNIMIVLEQTIQGWCNLMSSVLPVDKRAQGLKILFFLSRVAMNLNSCAGEMAATRQAAVIALCKRVLADLNDAVGQVTGLRQQCPPLNEILTTIQERLVTAADEVADFLRACRDLPGDDDDDNAF